MENFLKKMTMGLWVFSLFYSLVGGMRFVQAVEQKADEKLKTAKEESAGDRPTWVPMPSVHSEKVPGESTGQLGPNRQSSVAAGIQFKLDNPVKKQPKTLPAPLPTSLPHD